MTAWGKIATALWAVTAAAFLAATPAHAARTAGPVTVACQAGRSPACVAWQDHTRTRVVVDLELSDHAGAPIWWCLNAGGCWVGNDRSGVTGRNPRDLAAYLQAPDGVHGVLVLDGQVFTAADLRFVACLKNGGTLARCRAGR